MPQITSDQWALRYPTVGYPPLYSKNNLNNIPKPSLWLLVFSNLLLRLFSYPFSFIVNTLFTVNAIGIATFFNMVFLLGGAFHSSWFNMTGEANQVAIKRSLWLILDLCYFIFDEFNLIISLFSPSYAIATLNQLNEITYSLENQPWDELYLAHLERFTEFLRKQGWPKAAIIIAALGAEPVDSVVAGIRMPRGQYFDFHEYGVNPATLTPEQTKQTPVLLLHGSEHNQSAFLPMLNYFYQQNYSGPIFTLNIPSYENEAEARELTDLKIRQIDQLYKAHGILPIGDEPHIRCIIIGHSSGADEAVKLEKRESSTKRLLVLMGACLHSDQPHTYFNAKRDLILKLLPEDHDGKEPQEGSEVINVLLANAG